MGRRSPESALSLSFCWVLSLGSGRVVGIGLWNEAEWVVGLIEGRGVVDEAMTDRP